TLANAVGTGVADDKAVYPYTEDMIRFYLSEEPILRNVPTHICHRPADEKYTLDHLDELVVKAVNESGGYGMLMGPSSTASQRAEFAEKIRDNPRNYIAQPVVTLSTCPTWTDEGVAPRHVDLRPYIITGRSTWVLPGGLTRTLEVNHTLLLDFHVPIEQQWKPLLIISGVHDYEDEPTAENVQEYMTWDRDNPFSIASSLAWARENARIIREVISAEMWERMNFYHLWMQGGDSRAVYDA